MSNALRVLWLILSAPFRLLYLLLRGIYQFFRNLVIQFGSFFTEEPEDAPLGDSIQKAVKNPGDILVHLDALRKHLVRAFLLLVVTTAVAFAYTPQIMDWLAQPIGGIGELQAIEVTEPIGVVMRVALLTGFTVALPYISLELLFFAGPGLSRRARLLGLFAIPLIFIFFLAGMAFAYFYLLPAALPVLLNFMGIPTLVRPSSYIRFITGLMFWIGVAFEFPLVTYFLAAMGILRAETLKNQWRLAVVLLSVLAAAITPTIDPVNMMLVWLPLVTLYFLSIGLAYLAQGRRKARVEEG